MQLGRTHAGADPPIADSQVVRANKLDLIERLADDLAHEIKNPLHSMVINLEVLKRRIARAGGSPPEELLRYVGVLGSELDRVTRRVEILLRLVRPDRGTAEPATLDGILEELLELLDLERERRGVLVRYEPASVPVRGHLPLYPARQLVLNLLVDALELVPPGGEVTVRTEIDPPWARMRIERAAPGADAAAAGPERSSGASAARFEIARGLADSLGGHLEVTTGARSDGLEHSESVPSIMLSLPLTMSDP